MIADFHFLRPWWLLLVPIAAALLWLWRRRADPRRQWQGTIAPHLLDALVVGGERATRFRPIHLIALALALSGIAVAGPTWRREPPPFGESTAPMVIAIDLSPTMDATDVGPTRLARVQQKVHDLLAKRPGARTGLVVYAGTAHLVVPPTEDPSLVALYLDALATGLMPVAGRNATAALDVADGLLAGEAGSIVFFTDGVDPAQITPFADRRKASAQEVLMLGVGTTAGGPIRTATGVATDASGRPVQARFDSAPFEKLSSEAGVPVSSVTLDDADLDWVMRRAQRHLDVARAKTSELRWHESGWWLTFPIALLTALWFRRGWVVRWGAAVVVALLLTAPAHADVVDLFLTPDQQGRWAFEHGDYDAAATRFTDPMWQGIALYRAGKYQDALAALARLDSAEAFFLMGNCQARLGDYTRAVSAYDNALKERATFPEATANRTLVAALLAAQQKQDDEPPDPNLAPDDVQFDDEGKRGKQGPVDAPLPKQVEAELWMRNLQTSPADFLRQKFQIQAQEAR